MKISRTIRGMAVVVALVTFIGVAIVVFQFSSASSAESTPCSTRSSIPYVATRSDTVRDMLCLANVGKEDVVYDLGSGDGRIVIAAERDFGARRAVGIEIDANHIRESRENARKAEVTERVEFIKGDLFEKDFHKASVVTLFLGHGENIKLRPRMLRILKPGTRIVSHQFNMGEWRADKTMTTRTVYLGMYGTQEKPFSNNSQVPDYSANELTPHQGDRIFMWVVPAPVAGIWQGKIETSEGLQDFTLSLQQSLSRVTGRFDISGPNHIAGGVFDDLWGKHLRYWCRPDGANFGRFELRFDGHVVGNTMEGALIVSDRGNKFKKDQWEVLREKVDYSGTWEWTSERLSRSFKLRIEKSDGNFTASYVDANQTIPVTDFYDFGGGYYFTLLLGQTHGVISEDTGWLTGEGIMEQGVPKGRVEFYPYKVMPGISEARFGIRDWKPRLIEK